MDYRLKFGKELDLSGNFDGALALFNTVLANNPDSNTVKLQMAQTLVCPLYGFGYGCGCGYGYGYGCGLRCLRAGEGTSGRAELGGGC